MRTSSQPSYRSRTFLCVREPGGLRNGTPSRAARGPLERLALAAVAALACSTALSPPARAEVLGPPWLEPALAYYHSFESDADQPDANPAGLVTDLAARVGPADAAVQSVGVLDEGFVGRGLAVRSWQAPLVLRGPALSPHRPLTLSFWWALPEGLRIDGGFELFSLNGGGLVSHFVRGKGEWCALQKPAGVFQVYYFAGIQNVNGIYETDLLARLDLRKGVWHQETVVFRRAQQIQVYTDGEPVFETSLVGREFSEADNLTSLSLGGPLWIDELSVLDRAIEPEQVRECYRGMWQIHQYGGPMGP
jgi:hypothetical protein